MSSITDQVDALFAQWTAPDSPGCVIAIIREGQVLYTRGYGMANVEQRLPLTSTTVFNIGSTAKQFTAMSIALLAEQHALALDDDIRMYLPELPAYAEAITIRHLIHHTSGVRECLTLLLYAGKSIEVVLPTVALEVLARQQDLNFPPGEQHQYNNSNYGLLALIIERVTGASLDAWARQHIFDPLGMRQTQFYSPAETASGQRATGYWADETGRYIPGPDGIGLLGAGGLYTTAEDLARWDGNFYHPVVGNMELIDQLVTPAVLTTGRPTHYAFGLIVQTYRGLPIVHHAGAWAGFGAQLLRFPDQQFSVVCLSNSGTVNPSQITFQITQLYLADQFVQAAPRPRAPIDLPVEALPAYTGSFREVYAGRTCEVSVEDGRLVVHLYMPRYTFALTPISPTTFSIADAIEPVTATFERPSPAAPLRMYLVVEGEEAQTFVAFQRVVPRPEQLDDYAGSYWSDELQATWRFVREGDHLVNARHAPFEPTMEDGFRGPFDMHIEFFRDEQHVTGFNLYAEQASKIRFVRVTEGQPPM